jgi:hypothetical protein
MTDVTLPTIHLNGTSRQTLTDGYFAAHQRLCEAIAAFQTIEFNARDYYVAGPDAWSAAYTERGRAGNHLHEALMYLEAHLIHLGE